MPGSELHSHGERVQMPVADDFDEVLRGQLRLPQNELCVAATPLASYVGLARVIQVMDLRPMLGSISCPALVLCGDQDHNTGPKTAQVLAELIPNSQAAIFSGSGHCPNIEVPGQFNRAIAEFVG
jgi:pimeloyl-ACP methyl ester carboxylesterase